MSIFEIISVCVGSFYALMILVFNYGFKKINYFEKKHFSDRQIKNRLSVIIPLRNEEKNIEKLLKNLENQILDKDLFEIIFIDDNSEDNTFKFLNEKKISDNITIHQLSHSFGKKAAINTGIQLSKNNIAVTSDADCEHGKHWLLSIYEFFEKHDCKMLIGPVKMEGKGIAGAFQTLEFLSLTSTSAGACGVNMPIMCNGANLAYYKELYLEHKNPMNEEYASGDDIFLLHKIKRNYRDKIFFLKNKDAIVRTNAEKSTKAFINQRIRWSSKTKRYFDIDTIAVAVVVLCVNVLIPLNLIFSLVYNQFPKVFLIMFLLKISADYILLKTGSYFFDTKKEMKYFLIMSIFYPFYIIFTGFAGLFSNKIVWKGRKTD